MMKTKLFKWITTEQNCDIWRDEFDRVIMYLGLKRTRNYSEVEQNKVLEGCRVWIQIREASRFDDIDGGGWSRDQVEWLFFEHCQGLLSL